MIAYPRSLDDGQPCSLLNVEHSSMNDLTLSITDPIAQVLRHAFQDEQRYSFPLGSKLLYYEHPNCPAFLDVTSSRMPCFLIWDGLIRLLHRNEQLQRDLSTIVLRPGDIVGADHLFYEHPLDYRAIAATPCQIIQLTYDALANYFETYSYLHTYLSQKMQMRERLIFFKSFTCLRSHSSQRLQQQLLPYLLEQHIAAGTALSQPVCDRPTYVWLRSGRVINPAHPDTVPQIGDGWQEGTPPSNEWIADTDLTVYKLLLS